MEQFTKGSGLRVCQMVKDGVDTQMDRSTKECGKTDSQMERD